METKNYHEMKKLMTPKETDFTGKWKPGDIFRGMQEAAEEHVELLGFGFKTLRAKNIAWILSRMELYMERYPVIGDEVIIATWAGETKHSVYPRYFEFLTPEGESYGKAISLWVLLDLEKRSMLTTEKAGVYVTSEKDHGAILPFPSSPKVVQTEQTKLIEKVPCFGDLDVNRHVNNTRYIDWICDLLPLEKFETGAIRHILINYAEEIHAEEHLTLMLTEDEKKFSLRDCPDGKSHFTIIGEWF